MKRAVFKVGCYATYTSHIDVPDDATVEEILEKARDKLGDLPVENLEWYDDLDPNVAITEYDIISITPIKDQTKEGENI